MLYDENRITLPKLEAKPKYMNTKKASGHYRISSKIISCLLPSLTSIPHSLYNVLAYRGLETSHGPDRRVSQHLGGAGSSPTGSVGQDLYFQKLNYQYLTISVAVVLFVR